MILAERSTEMTDMEKFRMYQDKYRFIQKVDLILTTPTPKGFTTESIDYELWEREFEGLKSYQEVIVITFKGGGQLPFSANGNSNIANFQQVATYCEGGDYSFVPTYQKIKEFWTRVDLD